MGSSHVYWVVAENSDALRSNPSARIDGSAFKIIADPPRNLSAIYADGGVKLSWGEAKNALGYIVQRSSGAAGAGANFLQISGTVATNSFIDYSALPNRRYTYRVLAADKFGNISDPVEVVVQK